VRNAALKDTLDLYASLMSCNSKICDLPAVSFVKPDGYLDGHPASSKVNLLEGFVKKIVDMTKANSTLWADTAIFVTFDEGGDHVSLLKFIEANWAFRRLQAAAATIYRTRQPGRIPTSRRMGRRSEI
jgi:hypothetical protein